MPSHAAVAAFRKRAEDGHPHEFVLDFGDCFDNWYVQFQNKSHDADSLGSKAVAGAAHPKVTSSVMAEVWQWNREHAAFKRFMETGDEDDQVCDDALHVLLPCWCQLSLISPDPHQ